MSVAVEDKKSETTEDVRVQVVVRDKGVVNPFYCGVVTSSIYKKSELHTLERDYEIVKELPLGNGFEAEKLCLATPIQYYIMAGFGDSLEGNKLHAARFYRHLDQLTFLLMTSASSASNVRYEKFDLSILPPIGAYFAGIIASHVYANSLDDGLTLLFMHLKSQSFLENLEKVGFTKV